MRNELTYKQNLFVDHFLDCLNASEAARKAGYSRKSNVTGSELLRNPAIRNAIQSEFKSVTINREEAIARLSTIAKGSMGDFLSKDEHGKFYFDLQKAKDANKLLLIKKIKITKDELSIELIDSLKALEIALKYSDIFEGYKGESELEETPWSIMRKYAEEHKLKGHIPKQKRDNARGSY